MGLRVLVACEWSGVVRDAFIAKGHDAISCDLIPTESEGPHIQGEVELVLEDDSIVAEDADKAGLNSDTEIYTPTFGHGFVGNEEIDPDRLESEEDARD